MHLPTADSSNFCAAVCPSSLASALGAAELFGSILKEFDVRDRTTRKSVTFSSPFKLAGVDEKFDAGTYVVETREEMIEGLSFVAYRRVETTIEAPFKGFGQAARQVTTIDPKDLEMAMNRDVMECLTEPLACEATQPGLREPS